MKVWNYVVMILGLLVLLDFAGLSSDKVGILILFGFARDPITQAITFNPSLSSIASFLYSNIESLGLGVLIGLGVAGIAVGTFAKGRLENFIILPVITTTLVLFIGSLKEIVTTSVSGGNIPSWVGGIVAFIGVILAGGLIISLYEHFRGTD